MGRIHTRISPRPQTVKSAAQQLLEKGVLTNAKSYTAYVWKWTLQPINILIPPLFQRPKKKSALRLEIPNLDPSNPQSVKNEDLTTTTVLEESLDPEQEQKLEACRTAGIYYHPKDAKFLRNFSLHKILKAIIYFLFNSLSF
jgi:hypothetical protein